MDFLPFLRGNTQKVAWPTAVDRMSSNPYRTSNYLLDFYTQPFSYLKASPSEVVPILYISGSDSLWFDRPVLSLPLMIHQAQFSRLSSPDPSGRIEISAPPGLDTSLSYYSTSPLLKPEILSNPSQGNRISKAVVGFCLDRDSEVVNNVAHRSSSSFRRRPESSGVDGDEVEGSREVTALGSGPSAEGPERRQGLLNLRGMPHPKLKEVDSTTPGPGAYEVRFP